MTPEKENATDFFDFLGLPGHSLFTLGEDLLVRKKHPSSSMRDEDEIIGRIREVIVRRCQNNPDGAPEEPLPSPIMRILKFDREGGESTDYLLTLLSRHCGDGSSIEYRAMVQDISGCLQKIHSSPPSIERGSVNVQTFRKFLHELSNPLSIISGFTEFMLASMPEEAPNREFVQEIFSNALRLREIIEKASPARRTPSTRERGTEKGLGAL